jgi:class 3 adenylate cyclase
MVDLPTGTVSLLFSDIEGSTVLLSRLGPAYADALDGQRRVLRKAWAEHGGIELGTEGDSFFVVFPTAEGAVAAAAQAQRELAAFAWPGGEDVRVRMGIHTGTPQVHDGGYVGMDVHRAARIAGSAHGGQVVLSQATAHLVDGCLPEATGLRGLGNHQLKEIAGPERLSQLVIDDLRNDFPPLKTLGASSSLPRPATPLVGRDGEVAELDRRVGVAAGAVGDADGAGRFGEDSARGGCCSGAGRGVPGRDLLRAAGDGDDR